MRIDTATPSSLTIRPTAPRATAPSAEQSFRATLSRSAGVMLGGLEAAASFVPGGRALAAAVTPGGASTPHAATTGATGNAMLRDSHDQTLELLELQQSIGLEQQRFSTVSNVLKARHDTAKSVIGNVR